MPKEHLIPLNKRTPEERRRIQSKGGQSKSPRKQLAARMNGILGGGIKGGLKLDSQDQIFAAYMKEGKLAEAVYELVIWNFTEGKKDPERRDKVISQIQGMMPKTNLNYNVNEEKKVIDIAMNILNKHEQYEIIKEIGEELKKI